MLNLFALGKIGEAFSDSDFVTAFATVLLALITGGLVLVGYRQIQTSRAQLRAYVSVFGTDCNVKDGRFTSHYEIFNAGQTPANNMRIISRTCVLLHPVREDFDFNIPPQRWSRFLRQPVKVDLTTQRTIHHEDAETIFG
jgi:hypothetical protein